MGLRHGALCAAVVFGLAATLTLARTPKQSFPKARQFEFTYQAKIKDIPTGNHVVRIWIPVARSNAHQTVKLLKISGSVPSCLTQQAEYGDRMLYAEIRNPGSPEADFTLRYRVRREEYSKGSLQQLLRYNNGPDPAPPGLDRFLEPDRLIPVTGKMKALADKVTAGKHGPIEKARAVYDYLFYTMRYDKSGSGWGRGDALWACDAKHGNCTDFHSPFIGMMRAEHVPARFVIGFPLPGDSAQGMIPGYHCWAEFYAGRVGWIPVDISEAWLDPRKYEYFFGTVNANRVRFSEGRDVNLAPRQSGPPLNYFVYPYVEVDGKPFDHVEKTFAFHDVSVLKPGSARAEAASGRGDR